MPQTRAGAVALRGNPVDLIGPELKVGDDAPDFLLQSNDLSNVSLAHSAGKTRVFATVPSLDTPVCSIETKKFNEDASKLPNAIIYCVSTDLPFGQKRWCGAENVANVVCLSDHRAVQFGEAYGVLISGGKLERCLTRAIFVVGPDNKIKHVEYVADIATEPDYAAALAAAGV